MTPGSGSPSLHEAMPDIPTELCLVLLTPVQQEASELSSAVSEPSSSWVETLLISLYSCVCFYFCLHCPLLHPCVYLFTCLMGKRGNISSKPLFFTQNKYPVVSHGKRSSFPWAFQPFSVPAQTMLLFLRFSHLSLSDDAFSLHSGWVFPYSCLSCVIWYSPGWMPPAGCFFLATLWCTSMGPSFPKCHSLTPTGN